jgi:hypothetical protein
VGAGATRHRATMSYRAYCPCPLGVRGESERPDVFGSFFVKKNNLFPMDLGKSKYYKNFITSLN